MHFHYEQQSRRKLRVQITKAGLVKPILKSLMIKQHHFAIEANVRERH